MRDTRLGRLASLGERFAGRLLDSIIAVGILVAGVIPAAFSPKLGAMTLVGAWILAILYLLFADGLANGQSYGKRSVKTAVVDVTTGRPCSYGQSFTRNFLLALLGLVDWIFIFGEKRQRLGDKAANTRVIRRDV